MSIMEKLFGKPTPQAQQFAAQGPVNPNLNHNPQDPSLTAQQRQAALQNQSQQQGQTNIPNPNPAAMNNQAAGTDAQGGAQTSPLDDFTNMWEAPPKETQQKNQQRKFVYPKFDNAKLSERVNQMNFAASIPDELISKAMSDPASFREVLNTVGRQGFQSAFTANNNLNSQLFSQFDASVDERIPAQVKGIQNQAAVFAEFKDLNHPAIAPMMRSAVTQIEQMFPDASPEEIKVQAKKYLVTMAKLINTQMETESATNTNQQQNQRNGGGNQQSQQNRVTDFSNFDSF